MRIHIRRTQGDRLVLCGVEVEEIYRTLTEHLTTEAGLGNPNFHRWSTGDHACLACVRKARPSAPKQLRACRSMEAGDWVVLCGCGGVRPYGVSCGGEVGL